MTTATTSATITLILLATVLLILLLTFLLKHYQDIRQRQPSSPNQPRIQPSQTTTRPPIPLAQQSRMREVRRVSRMRAWENSHTSQDGMVLLSRARGESVPSVLLHKPSSDSTSMRRMTGPDHSSGMYDRVDVDVLVLPPLGPWGAGDGRAEGRARVQNVVIASVTTSQTGILRGEEEEWERENGRIGAWVAGEEV